MSRWAAATAVIGVLLLAVTGCGSPTSEPSGTAVGGAASRSLDVVAGFYPLAFVTERIGGDRVTVRNITPPGAEPHDLELTPRDVASVVDADLVIHLGGFQPALDEAVVQQAPDSALDVAPAARLDLVAPGSENRDPHFWLDPRRLAAVGALITERLASADPDGSAVFAANLASLRADLTGLDEEARQGLSTCTSRDLVTSHLAFGYFARRYGLAQVGVSGLSPEEEPEAATLARVARYVRDHHVTTVYFETLVSPAVAMTVADEMGARTAVLDPFEGPATGSLEAGSEGPDYFTVMRANLAALREGQPCP